jgi:hypothetical protein
MISVLIDVGKSTPAASTVQGESFHHMLAQPPAAQQLTI